MLDCEGGAELMLITAPATVRLRRMEIYFSCYAIYVSFVI